MNGNDNLLTAVMLAFGRPILLLFGASEDTISFAADYMNIYCHLHDCTDVLHLLPKAKITDFYKAQCRGLGTIPKVKRKGLLQNDMLPIE